MKENRDGGTCGVPQALSYVGLERQYNFKVTARMLLNGDLRFRASCNFNALRVAKMAVTLSGHCIRLKLSDRNGTRYHPGR
jgi:hypothetical protein